MSTTGSVTIEPTLAQCIAVHNARMPRARRLRGALLRLMLNRPLAIAAGAALALPGVLLLLNDYAWESGATDGAALIALATGIAVAWAGITGRKPDWV
jgi:hypothetical protein